MRNITPHGLAKISRDLGVPMEEAEVRHTDHLDRSVGMIGLRAQAYMILARHAVPAASSKMPFNSVSVEVHTHEPWHSAL